MTSAVISPEKSPYITLLIMPVHNYAIKFAENPSNGLRLHDAELQQLDNIGPVVDIDGANRAKRPKAAIESANSRQN